MAFGVAEAQRADGLRVCSLRGRLVPFHCTSLQPVSNQSRKRETSTKKSGNTTSDRQKAVVHHIPLCITKVAIVP